MSSIFTVYSPQDDGIDKIAENTDDNPSAKIHICDDFNIHHKEWLVHSNKSDEEGRYCYDFSITYDLIQIIDKHTHVPDTTVHRTNLLNLFFASCPEKCFLGHFWPFTDHC